MSAYADLLLVRWKKGGRKRKHRSCCKALLHSAWAKGKERHEAAEVKVPYQGGHGKVQIVSSSKSLVIGLTARDPWTETDWPKVATQDLCELSVTPEPCVILFSPIDFPKLFPISVNLGLGTPY